MIVDSGILYALVDPDDEAHEAAVGVLARREVRVVPEPVVAETAYLVLVRLGAVAEAAFLGNLDDGTLTIECPTSPDRARIADLVATYGDAEIGYVDAAVVAMAERLGETRIATLDHRDFALVRPRHVEAFELLP